MNDTKIVLVGDVVASRKINDRAAFDRIFLHSLEELNRRNPCILSPYTLTIGDEIQAVFDGATSLFHDAISILAAIYPQQMRFSFGLGKLIKPINPRQAIGMDGPAFYYARDGVEELKKSGYLFTITGEDIPCLFFLRQNLLLISHYMGKWNKTRFQVMEMIQGNVSVKEVAALLHLSEQAVYKTMRAGALEVIISLFQEIEKVLDQTVRDEK